LSAEIPALSMHLRRNCAYRVFGPAAARLLMIPPGPDTFFRIRTTAVARSGRIVGRRDPWPTSFMPNAYARASAYPPDVIAAVRDIMGGVK
jgi:hypothetical protein